MTQLPFDRESIAMQVLMESIGQIGMSDIMNASRCSSPEVTAKELAVLSFAIADAMLSAREERNASISQKIQAKAAEGESK